MAYNVKFLKGTQANFDAATKNADTFYYVDGKDLYLGSIKLSNAAEIAAAVESIGANATDISNIKTALGQFTEGKFNALSGEFETAKSDISTLKTDVSGLQTTVADHTTRLGQVEVKASNNATAIEGLQGSLSDLSGIVATDEALQAEINRAKGEEARIAGLVATEQGRAEEVEADFETRIAAMETFWDATEDKDEVVNTLKEIQDYIASDESGAATMAGNIQTNAQAIARVEEEYKAADGVINGAIDALDGRLDVVEGHTADLNPRMTAVEKAASDNATNIGKNAENIGKNAAAIATNVENIGKNAEAIATEKSRAEGVEAGHEARIKSLEEMTTGGTGSIAQQIASAKSEAIAAAKEETTSQVGAATSALQGEITAAASKALEDAKSDAASKYATLAQGAKADSALQAANISTGTANGTIKVKGEDVAVAGLGSAAFTEASAYDVSGAAASALTAAKEYANGLADNYDVKGSAATAETNAKAYVDTALTWGTF